MTIPPSKRFRDVHVDVAIRPVVVEQDASGRGDYLLSPTADRNALLLIAAGGAGGLVGSIIGAGLAFKSLLIS